MSCATWTPVTVTARSCAQEANWSPCPAARCRSASGREEFDEGRATLEPGDTLLVHSDGLVELDDQPVQLGSYVAEVFAAVDAADAVRRLQARMPSLLRDDVTVLVLRRQVGPATLVESPATHRTVDMPVQPLTLG